MEKLNINTNGNRKLQNTDKVRFIIWNLPAVKTCPFRTKMCEKSCYARKAERIYPQVLPSRELNYTASLQPDFVENMIYTIEKEIASKKYTGKKIVFRIHESGDFYSLEYVWKWEKIAKHFENDNRIVFLAYTKSIAFFTGIGKYGTDEFPKNFVVRSSIWNDTAPENIQLTTEYNFPIYTAGTPEEVTEKQKDGYKLCKCDNCGTCGKCWNNNIKDIIVKIH
jgi:hypothetical protein